MSAAIAGPTVVTGRAPLSAWIALTKPRIIELLLVTTVPSMMLAERGWPGTWLVVATVVGGTLSAAGANVLNNVCDRDIDGVMSRTADRPLPSTEIPPRAAGVFGVLLGATGFALLAPVAGLLAASLSTGALLFYVFVYTLVLKRRTAQNIVIGGVAGAVPVLVGFAAVTGELSAEALVLFALVCLWTPPHFWALAIRFRDDYRRAGVPMLPVVAGVPATILQIRIYTVATVACSLVLGPAATLSTGVGSAATRSAGVGIVYLVPVALAGAWFVVDALRLDEARAMRFFHLSITYLTVVFAAVALDALI